MESLPVEIEYGTDEATEEDSGEPDVDFATDSEESGDDEKELSKEEEIEKSVGEKVERKQERNAEEKEELEALTQGNYWQATKYRIHHAGEMLRITPLFTFVILLPVFLMGYWLIASGVLRNHRDNGHIFKPMAIIGMSFGLFITLGGMMVMQHPVTNVSNVLQATGNTLFFLGQYVLCAGYLGTIIVLLGSPAWSRRLARFAPLGRMALTNYIMHSVILTTMFYGYAGGLFGEISRAPQMLVVVAIIIFQMNFSRWWLSRYRFGPLEWLWRSLSYNAIQPMKITS
jgi:uncharacterized protein